MMTDREKQCSNLIDGLYELADSAPTSRAMSHFYGAVMQIRTAMREEGIGPDSEADKQAAAL